MKDIVNEMKAELKTLGICSLVFAAAMLIIFSSENIWSNLRIILGFIWVFVLPGWSLLLLIKDKLQSVIRFIISIPLSAVIIGTTSYYAALIGIDVHSHGYWMPIVVMILAAILLRRQHTKQLKAMK